MHPLFRRKRAFCAAPRLLIFMQAIAHEKAIIATDQARSCCTNPSKRLSVKTKARFVNATTAQMRAFGSLYKAGLGDFPAVMDAEKTIMEFELNIAYTRACAAVQSVLLYKARAGGWPQ